MKKSHRGQKTKMAKLNKINLYKEIIVTQEKELLQALNSKKEFGITIKGEIKYAPFKGSNIFVYKGGVETQTASINKQSLLGTNYQLQQKDDRVLIKAADAWQEIINYNIEDCDFDDISGSGIDAFGDQKIEDMSWMIIDFDVTYAEILEFLQDNTDITLLCIEKEAPYQFSAMGYFDNIKQTQEVFYSFCQQTIKDKLANDPDFTYEYLDSDQLEAVEFFKVK